MLQSLFLLLATITGIIAIGIFYAVQSEKKVIASKYDSLKQELLKQNPFIIQNAIVYKETSSGFKTYVHGDSVTDIYIADNYVLIACVKNFIGYPDLLISVFTKDTINFGLANAEYFRPKEMTQQKDMKGQYFIKIT